MAYIVAIDGPAGAGKGSISKAIAKELKLATIDTGMLYRAHAVAVLLNKIDINNDELVTKVLDKSNIELKIYKNNTQRIFLNGKDISRKIRTPEVNEIVSHTSSIPEVREKITNIERNIAKKFLKSGISVIMEGRDITTVVFPDADFKFYLDATPYERAKRRLRQNKRRGIYQEFDEVLKSVMKRDFVDMNKEVGALKIAKDAIYIDGTHYTISKTKEKMIGIITKKEKNKSNYRRNSKLNKTEDGTKSNIREYNKLNVKSVANNKIENKSKNKTKEVKNNKKKG